MNAVHAQIDASRLDPVSQSPLAQFKAVHDVDKVICRTNFLKIIKVSDGSPACTKSKSAAVLILRGWAHESDNGQILYFMKLNSTGKLVVTYASTESYGSTDVNPKIFNGLTMQRVSPTLIEVVANQNTITNDSNTITYMVKSHGTKGIYWLSLDTCRFVPIVVEFDNSKITNSDLQFYSSGLRCPVSLLQYKIVGFEGIEPEYVMIVK